MQEGMELMERIADRVNMKKEDLVRAGVGTFLLEKKKEYLQERFEILSKYNVFSTDELREKIKAGEVAEHPTWEELIEIKNIETQLRELEDDIENLQRP